MLNFPKAWKLIDNFKLKCISKGWKVSESYDWVLTENKKYHVLVWAKTVFPASFERIATDRKCIIKEGINYKVVNASYYAWILEVSPSENLLGKALVTEEILRNNAIYDLSGLCKGENVCLKLNETESEVFMEFENFLKKLGVKVLPLIDLKSGEIPISEKF